MTKKKVIYIIGSLKNWKVIDLHLQLEKEGFEPFTSWLAPGPEADDFWKKYTKKRGLTHKEALKDWSAQHIFEFDKTHLDRADVVVMLMPCGKSGHLELGYSLGKGKKGYILFDKEPKRYDVMHIFATDVFYDVDELVKELKND